MNTNKRNYDEGWVRCPSKSFPGKCYYFNVINGETVWSLNDMEKAIFTKNNIQRVTDKWHTYPEPNTPPTDECFNPAQNCQYGRLDYPQYIQHSVDQARPLFGQAVFPKYAPNLNNQYIPNFIWAPVPIHPSMIMGPNTYMKPSRMEGNHGLHAWEMKRNSHLQNSDHSQARNFLRTQEKNLLDFHNLNEPRHFQPIQKRQSHENLFNLNRANCFQNAHEKPNIPSFSKFQRHQEKTCHENWFKVSEPNLFQHTYENKPEDFLKSHEKSSHENLFNINKVNHFQKANENSHDNLFNIKKSNPFRMYQEKSQEENENIIFKNSNDSAAAKTKWGLDSHNFVRQNQQSVSNVYEHKTRIEQQLFRQNKGSQETIMQPSTSFKDPNSNRPDYSFRPQYVETSRNVQIQQNNVETFGSNSRGNIPANSNIAFGKYNLSPQKRLQITGITETSPQKRFKFIGQSASQTEKHVLKSKGNLENADDSACFEMEYVSPQKRFQNAKHISTTDQNSANLDDSAFDISEISPQKRIQSKISPQKRYQMERYVASKCNEIQPESVTSLSPGKRVFSTNINITTEDDAMGELDETDLRYILLAKRRKSIDSDETQRKGKKIKTSYSNYQEQMKDVSPKKRVTFNLGIEDDDSPQYDDDQQDMDHTLPEDLNINTLRNLAKPHSRTDRWYIVVHSDVLIEDFVFIEEFVQSDERCILLVPLAVRAEIDSWCVGDSQGRRRVLAARQLARRLAQPPPHVAVQLCEEDTSAEMSVKDSVLNCCFQALDENYHVVLVTNDIEMCNVAKSMDLHCFTLQEIKDHAAIEKPELSFDFRKITKEKSNGTTSLVKVIENQLPKLSLEFKDKPKTASNNEERVLFQITNDRNANAEKFPVNCFRKRMFDGNNSENNNNHLLFFRKNDTNISEKHARSQKSTDVLKISTDCEENRGQTVFPPRNQTYRSESHEYEDNKHATPMTSEINWHVQKFNIKGTKGRNHDNVNSKTDEDNSNTLSNTDNKQSSAHKINNINRYTIENNLKRFIVKHAVVEERIKTRLDEWICSFTQIMEETLSDVIQNHSSSLTNNLPPPWILPEATECIRDLYGDHTSIRIIVEKLATLLFENSCKKGYLKPSMTPNDFTKILGCGILLVQCLGKILPNVASLMDAEGSLSKLFRDVTEPASDPEPLQPLHTPVQTRCDLSDSLTEERRNFVKNPSEITAYLEKQFPAWQSLVETTDNQKIISTTNKFQEKNQQVTKLVRTFGRNLNMLRFNNNKSFVLKTSADKNEKTDTNANLNKADAENGQRVTKTVKNINAKENTDSFDKENKNVEKESGAKLLRKLAINSGLIKIKLKEIDVKKREENDKELTNMIDQMITGQIVTNSEENKKENLRHAPEIIRNIDAILFKNPNKKKDYLTDFDLNTPINDHGFIQNNEETTGPKVIRKVNALDAFEKKFNKKSTTDAEDVDYSVLDYEAFSENDVLSKRTITDHFNNHTENNDIDMNDATENDANNEARLINYPEINDEHDQNNDNYVRNNDSLVDDSNDSGFETEIQHAHSLVKTFLTELSETFKLIFSFLEYSVVELRDVGIEEHKRRQLHDKASVTHAHMSAIIEELKGIIERESNEGPTLMDLLTKAGADVSSDKRMTRYRQVVTKCLEQALMLENALRMFVGATEELDAASASTMVSSLNIQYLNIFE